MKILADKNIPYIFELFGIYNDVQVREGRLISAKHLKNIDALIVRSVTQVNQTLLSNNFLKFVGTATSGVDHIDHSFLKENRIPFVSAPGSNAVAVVEYVLTVLFWLAQRDGFFLRDKVVGIIGVGNIGNLLYKRLNNFGIHTLLYDPFVSKMHITNNNWKSLEELISGADILTLHTPLTYNGDYPTWHLIDFDVLEALTSNTILINTCRGAVIDNNALLKIFQQGKKLNVVLDVWESEPELSMPLVSYIDIGTPHIAGYTVESKMRGIVRVYNEYCKLFNIICNTREHFSTIHHITITDYVDEACLHRLIKYIYNIYLDDIIFRKYVFQSGGFDKLRRCYIDRREWSSFYIETCSNYNHQILNGLGFNVKFNE